MMMMAMMVVVVMMVVKMVMVMVMVVKMVMVMVKMVKMVLMVMVTCVKIRFHLHSPFCSSCPAGFPPVGRVGHPWVRTLGVCGKDLLTVFVVAKVTWAKKHC